MAQEINLAAEAALWFQRGCGEIMEFLGCHDVTGVSVPRGDSTPYYCRVGKRKWKVKRTARGAPGLGSLTMVTPETVTNIIAELPCPPNLYVLVAACGSDEDEENYDYLYIFNDLDPNSEDIDTLVVGTDPGAETNILLSMPCSFTERVKVKKWEAVERDVSAITTDDILTVAFCDDVECSNLCEDESIGCQSGWFGTNGTTAVLGQTTDGGGTWAQVATPFTVATDIIISFDCKGSTLIAINGTSAEYAYSWDNGTNWTVVTTPVQVMRSVFMLSATRLWMAGHGGYIYYSNDRGMSVTLQDAGVATTQMLHDIAFADKNRGYAVGNNNAFVYTRDGGATWAGLTGPSGAVVPLNDLYRVTVIPDTDIVFVGDETGNLYRSSDYGQNWTTVFASVAATAGGIYGIAACDCNVVAFVANAEDPYFYGTGTGVMYKSINGGASWTSQTVPSNSGFRDLICCNVNLYWVVGDAGFIAKVAGPVP